MLVSGVPGALEPRSKKGERETVSSWLTIVPVTTTGGGYHGGPFCNRAAIVAVAVAHYPRAAAA